MTPAIMREWRRTLLSEDTVADVACPCGKASTYDRCCGALHAGGRAVVAEQVMRARFSAFALGHWHYLEASWHSSTRPHEIHLDPEQRWTGLDVLATTGGGMLDQEGTVTFDAHWQRGARTGTLHEASRFAREDGRWVYVGPTA